MKVVRGARALRPDCGEHFKGTEGTLYKAYSLGSEVVGGLIREGRMGLLRRHKVLLNQGQQSTLIQPSENSQPGVLGSRDQGLQMTHIEAEG